MARTVSRTSNKKSGVILPTLSIKQPWLYCITAHGRRVENQTWAPNLELIGERIALHASKQIEIREWRIAAGIEPELSGLPSSELTTSAILATAVLAGVVWTAHDGVITRSAGPASRNYLPAEDRWFAGPIVWLLDDVRTLPEPVPAKGRRWIWRSPRLVI